MGLAILIIGLAVSFATMIFPLENLTNQGSCAFEIDDNDATSLATFSFSGTEANQV